VSTDPEPAQDAATGWARLPRWQHLVLIVLCAFGLVAAVANTIVASSNGNRAIHLAFGVVVAVVLVTLITSFQRRRRV
jgi:predicted Co/Zn/Cd cation transporter (cation efflux family)